MLTWGLRDIRGGLNPLTNRALEGWEFKNQLEMKKCLVVYQSVFSELFDLKF